MRRVLKEQVREQLGIPPQTEEVRLLLLSSLCTVPSVTQPLVLSSIICFQ